MPQGFRPRQSGTFLFSDALFSPLAKRGHQQRVPSLRLRTKRSGGCPTAPVLTEGRGFEKMRKDEVKLVLRMTTRLSLERDCEGAEGRCMQHSYAATPPFWYDAVKPHQKEDMCDSPHIPPPRRSLVVVLHWQYLTVSSLCYLLRTGAGHSCSHTDRLSLALARRSAPARQG